jgi:virginiamycin B lyase
MQGTVRTITRLARLIVAVTAVAALAAALASAACASSIAGSSYTLLPERTNGNSVAVAPDGTAWFGVSTELVPELARMRGHQLTVVKLGKKGHRPTTAALRFDPQGDLWFAEEEGGRATIVRRAPSGAQRKIRLPRGGSITGLAIGTEGDAWYTRAGTGFTRHSRRSAAIGRVTANGLGTQTPLARGSLPASVAVGPDGAAWFTETKANKIGRMAPGGKPQLFALESGVHPRQIVAGPDGALWFSEEGRKVEGGQVEDRIGRITTGGEVTQFPVAFGKSTTALAADPSGMIWFTTDTGEFASVSTAGVVGARGCYRSDCPTGIRAISLAPDGTLWFAADHESCSGCGGGSALMNANLGSPVGSIPTAALAPPAPASASTTAPFPSAEENAKELAKAQAYHGYPVYWAGEEVAGLALSGFEGTAGSIKKSGWTSYYGTCELSGTDHPSCSPPIQIQVTSTCRRWASALDRNKELFGFRGAQAYWFPGLPLEGGGVAEIGPLEIFTGRVTAVIFADTKKLSFAAARALMTVRQTSPAPLPPPAPGSLTGKLPCQTKPG